MAQNSTKLKALLDDVHIQKLQTLTPEQLDKALRKEAKRITNLLDTRLAEVGELEAEKRKLETQLMLLLQRHQAQSQTLKHYQDIVSDDAKVFASRCLVASLVLIVISYLHGVAGAMSANPGASLFCTVVSVATGLLALTALLMAWMRTRVSP